MNDAFVQPSSGKSAFVVSVTIINGTTEIELGGVCTSFGASAGVASDFSVIVPPDGVALGDTDAEPDGSGDGVGVGEGVGVAFVFPLGDALGAGVGSGRLKLN